jgi:tripartite-type tricarboxylate transporter receptor subunit TctC
MQWSKLFAAALITVTASMSGAMAQDYPNKPITLVVAYPPGAVTDALGRLTARALQKELKVPVIVDNKGGASGLVGARFVANAAPDGYTLIFAASPPQTILPHFSDVTGFDPLKDYTPLGKIMDSRYGIFVSTKFKANSIAELIEEAKSRPGAVKYGSAGIGSGNHLATELFAQKAGIKLLHVPYQGGAPAIVDLLNGNIDLFIITVPNLQEQAKAGLVKPLAVVAPHRLDILPDVPTIDEAGGVPGYTKTSWFGVEGPPNLPPEVVSKVSDALAKMGQDPEFKEAVIKVGAEVVVGTPEDMKKLIEAEYAETQELVAATKK